MWKKILLYLLGAIVLVVGGGLGYLYLKPVAKAAPLNIAVDRGPERVARGKYLFEVVSSCADCHSKVDETRFGAPIVAGGLAIGKPLPDSMGLPGRIVPVNLTSDPETGTGRFTDGQLIRAIREGIGHDDRVLFPMMPYSEYSAMSDEDVQSLVAYIRTIAPVKNLLPKTEIAFPVNLMIKSVPKPVGSVPAPDKSNRVEYGKYLAKIAGCKFCHTPEEHGSSIPGKEFSGGHEFQIAPGARAVTPNLTPDSQTGIGQMSEKEFLDKFEQYKDYAEKGSPKIDPVANTAMPWLGLCRMEPDDLKAIFAYLKTLPPIVNAVVTHPDAPEEKLLKKRTAK
jgi:mono/diheme cytochrome c family protein